MGTHRAVRVRPQGPNWQGPLAYARAGRRPRRRLYCDGCGTLCSIAMTNVWRPLVFLIVATTLEVSGDALVRMGLYNHSGAARIGLMLVGAVLLFGYGLSLNLAPLEFGQVVGLYIATLFVVWQVINLVAFRVTPTVPIVVGGALIIAGGLLVSFWSPTISD